MASKIVGVRIPDDLLQAIDSQGDGNRSETILKLLRIGLQHIDQELSNDVQQSVEQVVKQDDVVQSVLHIVKQELSSMVEAQVQESLGK